MSAEENHNQDAQATDQGKSSDENLRDGLRITWYGMAANAILVVLKLTVGFTGRSQALVADGVHSLSDIFSDVIVMVGLKLGRKEADESHPYGHGRFETMSSLVVGLVLIGVGISIAWHAIATISAHDTPQPTGLAILIATLSILVKELLYRYTISVGRRIRSNALVANAWHHRTDAFSSVAVLVGVGAAWYNPEWSMADSLAAMVVAYMIIRVGANLSREALSELVDTVPEKGVIDLISRHALAIEGVSDAHDIKARRSGPNTFIELHIVVDQNLTVLDSHQIVKAVDKRLLEKIEGAYQVIIHVDPDTSSDQHSLN